MNNYEEQLEIIRKHFENISEEELSENLEKCGINELKYTYIITMCLEELSNIEMSQFIQKVEMSKEEQEWKMEKNQQIYAA